MPKMMEKNEAIQFLIDNGLLFEINRFILHPLGLALAVRIDENGEGDFDGLWDARDEEEGMLFTDEVLEEGVAKHRAYLSKEGFERLQKRYEKLGFVRQEKYDREVIVKKAKEFREKLFGETTEEQPKEVSEEKPEEKSEEQSE